MKLDAKTIYAQSSDIKSRTYLEYRKDMKKKAIAELEVLEWLRSKLPKVYPQKQVQVFKSGGDAFVWFLREGGISRKPDFAVKIGDEITEFEFQYADKTGLNFYDFKVSKVARKKGGVRIPHTNKQFIYIVKPTLQYAIFDPEWILQNSEYGMVPAWRSYAYRVPRDKFEAILQQDDSLKDIIEIIDIKNELLTFQHQLLDIWKDKLSYLLQSVIDEDEIVKIIPKDLNSFFRVIFILDNLNKIPENASLWLIYLLSYISNKIDSNTLARIIYCIDFLYSKIKLKENELEQLVPKIQDILNYVHSIAQEDGTYKSSVTISPIEETRNALFSINLIEDMLQDMIYYYSVSAFSPVKKIFENVADIKGTYTVVAGNRGCSII